MPKTPKIFWTTQEWILFACEYHRLIQSPVTRLSGRTEICKMAQLVLPTDRQRPISNPSVASAMSSKYEYLKNNKYLPAVSSGSHAPLQRAPWPQTPQRSLSSAHSSLLTNVEDVIKPLLEEFRSKMEVLVKAQHAEIMSKLDALSNNQGTK